MTPIKDKIILGIDPGTTIMGYGLLHIADNKPQMLAMGVLELKKYSTHYLKLQKIYERVISIIDSYLPDELAIEAPFYGKNVQSMLKLGRAQGVAIAAALQRDIPIFEYAPRKVKMSVTGSGTASKEQIAALLPKFMTIHTTSQLLDETDAIAIAYCHFLQSNSPLAQEGHSCKSWSEYIKKNPDKLI